MESDHSEIFSTDNHKKIYVYNGHPKSVCLHGTDESAFLVRAYADSETGSYNFTRGNFVVELQHQSLLTDYFKRLFLKVFLKRGEVWSNRVKVGFIDRLLLFDVP